MIADAEHDGEQRFDSALRCAHLTEDCPELTDASAHLMAIAAAPDRT
jgi:hypothetical protein